MGGLHLWLRSAAYARSAWIAEEDEGLCREQMEMIEEATGDEELCRELLTEQFHCTGQGTAVEEVAILADFYRRRIDYYAKRAAKYRRAVHQPWSIVAPDPPLPEAPAEFVVTP